MFGDINKWQAGLNKIATKHDTDDEEGLHHVFTGGLIGDRAGQRQRPA